MKKGGNYEVQVALPRSVVLDLLLVRRRVQGIIDVGALYSSSEVLAHEATLRVLNGLIAMIGSEIRNAGFTWNEDTPYGVRPQA